MYCAFFCCINFQGIFLSRLCARQKGRLNALYLFGQEQGTFFVSELQLNFCTLQTSGLLCSMHESKSLAAAGNICAMEKGFSGFGEEGKK